MKPIADGRIADRFLDPPRPVIHPGFAAVDAKRHISFGMPDDVLGDTGRAFRRLEHVSDRLSQRMEDIATIEPEFGLKTIEPLSNRLAPFAVFVFGVTGDQVAIFTGT